MPIPQAPTQLQQENHKKSQNHSITPKNHVRPATQTASACPSSPPPPSSHEASAHTRPPCSTPSAPPSSPQKRALNKGRQETPSLGNNAFQVYIMLFLCLFLLGGDIILARSWLNHPRGEPLAPDESSVASPSSFQNNIVA